MHELHRSSRETETQSHFDLIDSADLQQQDTKNVAPASGYSQTLPALYGIAHTNPNDFNDINYNDTAVTGNGSFAASKGYDLATGLGTPVANQLVPDLINYRALTASGKTVFPTPLFQDVPTGSVLLATFSQGTATNSAKAYSATAAWGDGTIETTTQIKSPLNIVVTGQSIEVFGTHTFTVTGEFAISVTIDGPFGATATSGASTVVATDVTNDVGITRSGAIYNRSTKLFYGSLSITNNTAASLSGSLDILMQGLTSGVTLAYASVSIGSTTYSLPINQYGSGDQIIHIPQNLASSLLPGKTLTIALRFSNPSLALFDYIPKLFSDPFDN